jgi:hypothetical protein
MESQHVRRRVEILFTKQELERLINAKPATLSLGAFIRNLASDRLGVLRKTTLFEAAIKLALVERKLVALASAEGVCAELCEAAYLLGCEVAELRRGLRIAKRTPLSPRGARRLAKGKMKGEA